MIITRVDNLFNELLGIHRVGPNNAAPTAKKRFWRQYRFLKRSSADADKPARRT